MAHYYTINGEARHTQPTKKGAKNPERDTNITDARKQKLLPSVSAKTDLLANEGITQSKIKHVARAAFECPPAPDEPFESWLKHIKAKAKQEGEKAMKLGDIIHKALENYYSGNPWDAELDCYVYPTAAYLKEIGLPVVETEKVVVRSFDGYAGTTDAVFYVSEPFPLRGLLDYKSQGFDETPKCYPTHIYQLAAYHMAKFGGIKDTDCAYNIYISTTKPGLVAHVRHDAAALRHGWEVFQHLLALYRLTTKFDPRQL